MKHAWVTVVRGGFGLAADVQGDWSATPGSNRDQVNCESRLRRPELADRQFASRPHDLLSYLCIVGSTQTPDFASSLPCCLALE